MDTLNIQYFYGIGFSIGQVQALAMSSERLDQPAWPIVLASAIEWSKNCAASGLAALPKTNKAAAVLAEELNVFSKLLGEDRDVSLKESHTLQDAVTAFYHVFDQEVEDIHCYVVTPVGAYAVSALLKNASSHLSQAAQQVVDEKLRMISINLANVWP
jgi:hypothetical protein